MVLFSEFRSTERTRFGEKNKRPFCSVVPRVIVQCGSPREDHRFSFRQVKFEVSLRHPNDISKEAVGMQRSQGWRHVSDGRNRGSGGDCKERGSRKGREPRPEHQLSYHWKGDFLKWKL